MKKTAILLIALFLLCTNAIVMADEQVTGYVGYQPDGGLVQLSISTNAEKSKAPDDYAAHRKNERQYYIKQFNFVVKQDLASLAENEKYAVITTDSTDAEGNYSNTFRMPEGAPSGKYLATVQIGGQVISDSFQHINAAQAATAIGKLNSGVSLSEVISGYASDLGVDTAEFNTKVSEAYNKYKPSGTITAVQFYNTYMTALVKSKIISESDTEKIAQYLKKHQLSLGIDYSILEKESAAVGDKALKAMAAGYNDSGSFADEFMDNVMMAVINSKNQGAWNAYETALLTTYQARLKLDTSTYKNLKSPEVAIKAVMGAGSPKEYNEVSALKKAYLDAVSAQASAESRGTGGGTGSGSGSRPGNNNPVIDVEFEGDKMEENQEQVQTAFSDVGKDHWAYQPVEALYQKGIVSGKSKDSFEPDSSITRAEFAKIIANAFFKGESAPAADYSDVSAGDWYYDYVALLSGKGIIQGNPDGSFAPDHQITRQDMALILVRAAESKGIVLKDSGIQPSFTDAAEIDEYAADAVSALQRAGILSGNPDGGFAPKANLTRAEACKVIWQVIE